MVLTSQFPVSRHFLQQKADLVVAPGRLGQAGSHRDPWVLEVLEVLGFRLLIVSSAHSHHQFLFEALITVGTVRGKLVISNAKVGSERPRENKMQNSQRILVTLILRSYGMTVIVNPARHHQPMRVCCVVCSVCWRTNVSFADNFSHYLWLLFGRWLRLAGLK